MKYIFYITNHGFGHAARNVPIIENLLSTDSEAQIIIKSDNIRCAFLKKNLLSYHNRITYYSTLNESGLILEKDTMQIDVLKTRDSIKEYLKKWENYITRESVFLLAQKPQIVISDIVPWAIKAAKKCKIKTILIGNFTWSEMYKPFCERKLWQPYKECYCLADQAIWYEFRSHELLDYVNNYTCVSLVSRKVKHENISKIKKSHQKPIIFVSLGASAEIINKIYVGNLAYDFIVTRGINLIGNNVFMLPQDTINTPDYIAASEYVISKGGWSTIAEILLLKKKCALIFRGHNSEDDNTRLSLEKRMHCVGIERDDLEDIGTVIDKIKKMKCSSYDIYSEATPQITDIIMNMASAL